MVHIDLGSIKAFKAPLIVPKSLWTIIPHLHHLDEGYIKQQSIDNRQYSQKMYDGDCCNHLYNWSLDIQDPA